MNILLHLCVTGMVDQNQPALLLLIKSNANATKAMVAFIVITAKMLDLHIQIVILPET
jgi:hypothetical protein